MRPDPRDPPGAPPLAPLLRLVLRAFPRDFRETYGAEMLAVCAIRQEAIRATRGRMAAARSWLATARDLVTSGLAERLERRRGRLARESTGRTRRGFRVLSGVLTDVRFGARALRRSAGFTLVAVATLAVGIGTTTVVFAIVDGVLLQPLPYPEPDRLVRVFDTFVERGHLSGLASPANYLDWRSDTRSFGGLSAYETSLATYTSVQPAEAIPAAEVSAEWLDVLGIPPALGRSFRRDEEIPGSHRVVIVSHGFWQRQLGGDPGVVGRPISFEGEPHVVVGVMPAGFSFPTPATELWRPLAFDFDVSTSRGIHYLSVIGRLGPGVTIASASAELDVLMEQLVEAHPERLKGWGVRLAPLHESVVGDVRDRLWLLLGAVGLLLVIAGANVANLTMARAVTRGRELAVRAALGAGRWRLGRQLVTEGVLISIVAALFGLALAEVTLQGVVALAPGTIPRLDNVGVGGPVFGFAVAVALGLGVGLGLLPVLGAARPAGLDLQAAPSDQRATDTARHGRLRGGFVIAQTAIALVLVVGAGLLLASFRTLSAVDPGYTARRGLVASVSVPGARYPDAAAKARFFVELVDRLAAQPGVDAAGASTQIPLEGYGINFSYWLAGGDLPTSERPGGDFRAVTPGYFETLGVPLIAGRTFTTADRPDSPPVVVIDEALARLQFPDGDAVGRMMHVSLSDGEGPRQIVGVVGSVKQRALDVPDAPGYYLPIGQVAWNSMRVVLRTSVPPASLAPAFRAELAGMDPLLSARSIRTLDQHFVQAVGSPRFNTLLVGAFAAIAALLAITGLYGVMSYTVSCRTREIGVRMALGAGAREVRRSVAWDGLRLAGIGVALGLAAAAGLTRLLTDLLFGVSPLDPAIFAAAALGFIAVAWLGSYVPARRASRVDPLEALRAE